MMSGEGESVGGHVPGIATGSEEERQHGDAMKSPSPSAIDATLRTVRRLVAQGEQDGEGRLPGAEACARFLKTDLQPL